MTLLNKAFCRGIALRRICQKVQALGYWHELKTSMFESTSWYFRYWMWNSERQFWSQLLLTDPKCIEYWTCQSKKWNLYESEIWTKNQNSNWFRRKSVYLLWTASESEFQMFWRNTLTQSTDQTIQGNKVWIRSSKCRYQISFKR